MGTLIGATAHKSEGFGGNRGFRADENDHGVLGEVFSQPNAATFARGRLFSERGYVIKWSAVYRLPTASVAGLRLAIRTGSFSRGS